MIPPTSSDTLKSSKAKLGNYDQFSLYANNKLAHTAMAISQNHGNSISSSTLPFNLANNKLLLQQKYQQQQQQINPSFVTVNTSNQNLNSSSNGNYDNPVSMQSNNNNNNTSQPDGVYGFSTLCLGKLSNPKSLMSTFQMSNNNSSSANNSYYQKQPLLASNPSQNLYSNPLYSSNSYLNAGSQAENSLKKSNSRARIDEFSHQLNPNSNTSDLLFTNKLPPVPRKNATSNTTKSGLFKTQPPSTGNTPGSFDASSAFALTLNNAISNSNSSSNQNLLLINTQNMNNNNTNNNNNRQFINNSNNGAGLPNYGVNLSELMQKRLNSTSRPKNDYFK